MPLINHLLYFQLLFWIGIQTFTWYFWSVNSCLPIPGGCLVKVLENNLKHPVMCSWSCSSFPQMHYGHREGLCDTDIWALLEIRDTLIRDNAEVGWEISCNIKRADGELRHAWLSPKYAEHALYKIGENEEVALKTLKSVKGEKDSNSGLLTMTHFTAQEKPQTFSGQRFNHFFGDLGSVPDLWTRSQCNL